MDELVFVMVKVKGSDATVQAALKAGLDAINPGDPLPAATAAIALPDGGAQRRIDYGD